MQEWPAVGRDVAIRSPEEAVLREVGEEREGAWRKLDGNSCSD